jgi:poly-gamma-glutamate synthesis protein (capsule biosynthesis protein)
MITVVRQSSDGIRPRVVHAVALTVALLANLFAAAQSSAPDRIYLLFTGDILLSRQVQAEVRHRNRSPWSDLRRLFQGAEWVGGNLEGAVGPASDCVSNGSPCFAVAENDISLLKAAGFRALTTENNHAGDLGSPSRKRTLEELRRAGLVGVDFESSPQFTLLRKVKIALIAVTTIPAADGRVQQVPSAELLEKLQAAKLRADLVMVSIHWGNELVPWPGKEQRRQAAWLVEHGADVVLGHHPHVIQPPGCVAGRPVFFSLGNHVFDQADPRTKEGLIADCEVSRGRMLCHGLRTRTRAGSSFPRIAGVDEAASKALAGCAFEIK